MIVSIPQNFIVYLKFVLYTFQFIKNFIEMHISYLESTHVKSFKIILLLLVEACISFFTLLFTIENQMPKKKKPKKQILYYAKCRPLKEEKNVLKQAIFDFVLKSSQAE